MHSMPEVQGCGPPVLPLLGRVLPQQLAAAPRVPPNGTRKRCGAQCAGQRSAVRCIGIICIGSTDFAATSAFAGLCRHVPALLPAAPHCHCHCPALSAGQDNGALDGNTPTKAATLSTGGGETWVEVRTVAQGWQGPLAPAASQQKDGRDEEALEHSRDAAGEGHGPLSVMQ